MAWCTTTWGHSRPFTAWIEANVTPPASPGALNCSASHPGNRLGSLSSSASSVRASRSSPWADPAPWLHRSRAVALASRPPSPICDRSTASTSAVVPDLGRPPDPAHVVGQVPHLARLPVAALVLEPLGQAGQVLGRAPSGSPGRAATRSYPAWAAGPPPAGRPRAGPRSGAVATVSQARAARTPPRWRNRWLTPPSTGIPRLRRSTWTGRQRSVHPGQDGHLAGVGPAADQVPPPGRPLRRGRAVRPRPRRTGLAGTGPPSVDDGDERPGSPWPPAGRSGSADSTARRHHRPPDSGS